MGSLFSPPKPPTIVYPRAIPSTAPAASDAAAQQASAEALSRLKKQRGRASTILSSSVVGNDSSGLATKQLLGA